MIILTIGDSHTSGYPGFDPFGGGNEKSSYQYWLKKSLQDELNIAQINIINLGIPGDFASNIIDRLFTYLKKHRKINLDYIIINGGANDILGSNKSANETVKIFNKVFSHFQESKQNIIFTSITPSSFKDLNKELETFRDLLQKNIISNSIKNFHFCDFYHLLVNYQKLLSNEFNVGDGIHLTISGYKVLGEEIADLIIKHFDSEIFISKINF